jgi:hypothetical protein
MGHLFGSAQNRAMQRRRIGATTYGKHLVLCCVAKS